mmetsp:Transcript_40871/g.94872  ORF Transcript_40871/g.94872 Transcript_40871/m.94872 type:complete len:213 (+) Transcript_40871:1555-2193(+)
MFRCRSEGRSQHRLSLRDVETIEGSRGCGGGACLRWLRCGLQVQRPVDMELKDPQVRHSIILQAHASGRRTWEICLDGTSSTHLRDQRRPVRTRPLCLDLIAGRMELLPHHDHKGQAVSGVQLQCNPGSCVLWHRTPACGEQAIYCKHRPKRWGFTGSGGRTVEGQVFFRRDRRRRRRDSLASRGDSGAGSGCGGRSCGGCGRRCGGTQEGR